MRSETAYNHATDKYGQVEGLWRYLDEIENRVAKLDIDTLESDVVRIIDVLGIPAMQRVSASGNGKHIRIAFTQPLEDKTTHMKIRHMFGDDSGRILGDLRRLKGDVGTYDALYSYKDGEGADKWEWINKGFLTHEFNIE